MGRNEYIFRCGTESKQRLDKLTKKVGARSKVYVVRSALQLYDAIGLDREPGEPVTVYIGDDKTLDVTDLFDFEEEPIIKNRRTGEVIQLFDYSEED